MCVKDVFVDKYPDLLDVYDLIKYAKYGRNKVSPQPGKERTVVVADIEARFSQLSDATKSEYVAIWDGVHEEYLEWYKAYKTEQSRCLSNGNLVIGPSYPGTFDLYGHYFRYIGVEYASLFHLLANVSSDLSVKEAHATFVERATTNCFPLTEFNACWGQYAYQHKDKVEPILLRSHEAKRVFIEGLEEPFMNVHVIKDLLGT